MRKLYTSITPELITKDIARLLKEVEAKAKRAGLREVIDCPEVVGVLFDWEVVQNEMACAGWTDRGNRQIGINVANPSEIWIHNKTGKELSAIDLHTKTTLCHELGHTIQAEIGWADNSPRLMSERVYEEQQAETIAWYLHQILYPNSPRYPDMFKAYFNKTDHLWLCNWYDGYHENDLML